MSPGPDWYALVEKQIMELQSQYASLQNEMRKNTAVTLRTEENTRGVVEMFQAASGAFKVLEAIGKIAKPVAWIAAVFATISATVAWTKGWIVGAIQSFIR